MKFFVSNFHNGSVKSVRVANRVEALFTQALIWTSRPPINCWQSIVVEILWTELTLQASEQRDSNTGEMVPNTLMENSN